MCIIYNKRVRILLNKHRQKIEGIKYRQLHPPFCQYNNILSFFKRVHDFISS